MPPSDYPAFPSDVDVLRRVRKVIAGIKKLPDPSQILVVAPLRTAPMNFNEPGLRTLAHDFNREFSQETGPLALESEQMVAASVATVADLWQLVMSGLVLARVQVVLATLRPPANGTPIPFAARLREPPLAFSPADLARLISDINHACGTTLAVADVAKVKDVRELGLLVHTRMS